MLYAILQFSSWKKTLMISGRWKFVRKKYFFLYWNAIKNFLYFFGANKFSSIDINVDYARWTDRSSIYSLRTPFFPFSVNNSFFFSWRKWEKVHNRYLSYFQILFTLSFFLHTHIALLINTFTMENWRKKILKSFQFHSKIL